MASQGRGLLDEKQVWFVPWFELNDLDNIEKPEHGYLRKSDSELLETDQFIKSGDSFTISLESLFQKGRDSDNDPLVRSFVRYGNEPKVETIHFFQEDLRTNSFVDDLEHEHIFAQESFSEEARVWLAIEILEIDRGLSRDGDLLEALGKMRGKFGAIFPALNPFAPIAGVAIGLIRKLNQLKERAARNEPIFYNQFDLLAKERAGGDVPLRYGAYILFNKEVQGIQYRLGSEFKLKRRAIRDKDVPILHDYVVIKISPGIIESGQHTDQLLKNQKIATVISELDGEEADEQRRTEHYQFLNEMVTAAANFKDLDYFKDLMDKKELGIELTQPELDKLLNIKKRLGYLLDRDN